MAAARSRPRPEAAARRRFVLLMLLPATALLLAVTLFPFLWAFAMSLTDLALTRPGQTRFVGLANYADHLASPDFWRAARVTALFTLLAVSIQLVLGVGLAVLLHRETRGAWAWRLAFLLPMAITPVAAIFTFRMMFHPSIGVFNAILRDLGLPPVDWLGTPGMALVSLLIVDCWQWTPFVLLIAAGGLASLDPEPLEAAEVDGATPWQVLRDHTLPMLAPFLAVAVVFRAIDAFKTFDIIFVLTGGGPGVATRTLNLLAYKQGIEFLSIGYAAALAIVMLVVTIVAAQLFLRRTGFFRPRAAL
ncbi:carbohydrate ABC transporter permease [Rubellimicrobium sp. CFH 75288]|uniref:carbohydrate ABC transporter permease n=1 Tax=Rubellimicrobium sp. CFH 75288 TaxID=2697034 RepID=UPI00141213D0|nr:sugar ABC transporter permease [Rubellimicrobium sp. CFH 75288]NAZ37848.1 ABC transporter permease subunit [Rubellimicrobium sp. CFH 75288]